MYPWLASKLTLQPRLMQTLSLLIQPPKSQTTTISNASALLHPALMNLQIDLNPQFGAHIPGSGADELRTGQAPLLAISRWLYMLIDLLLCVCLCLFEYMSCVCNAYGSQKRTQDALEVELEAVVSLLCGCWELSWGSQKSNKCSLLTIQLSLQSPSLASCFFTDYCDVREHDSLLLYAVLINFVTMALNVPKAS